MSSINFSGNILLKENDSRFQYLYASQNYETLYAIYGKFKIDISQGNKKFLSRIDLQLLNYKGILNIGFTQENQTPFNQGPLSANEFLDLNVRVKALSSTTDAFIDLKNQSNPKGINIQDFKNIKVSRLLFPLSDNGAFNGEVFDNEFYYRDGSDIAKRPIRTGMADIGQTAASSEDEPIVIMITGPRCHNSFLEAFTL